MRVASGRRLLVLLLAFAGCRAVLGVEEPIEGDEASCLRNSDCSGSDVCLFRICAVPCAEDGDCGEGRRCVAAEEGTACVAHARATCGSEECPSGLVCVDGACRSECARDADCLADQRCAGGACRGTSVAHDPTAVSVDGNTGAGGRVTSSGGAGGAGGEAGSSLAPAGGRAPSSGGSTASDGGSAGSAGAPEPLDAGAGGEPVAPEPPATGGAGPTGDCEPGQSRCSAERLERCEADGRWSGGLDCPFVCDPEAAACAGVCVPGTPRCNQNVPELCSESGEWVAGDACEAVCSGGQCTGSCAPGTRDCNLLRVQECSGDGTWQPGELCEFVCAEGECGGECSPGSARCRDDARTLEQCGPTGEWDGGSLCPFACVGDECAGSCVPGGQSCRGDVLYTCGPEGEPDAGQACEFVCRQGRCTGECRPGSTTCRDNRPWRCDADGVPEQGPACTAAQLCREGECVANDPYAVGSSTRLATASPATAANVLWLSRVSVPRRATLRRFGVHGEPGAQARFGLYSDSGGRPRSLVASSDAVALRSSTSQGATDVAPITSITLEAQNYWIAVVYSATASTYYAADSRETTHYLDPQSFGASLPATYPSSGTAELDETRLNHFIVVQDLPEE